MSAQPQWNRFRYGPWRGGPDPLAAPYDVRAAVDEVGRNVLAGGSLRDALRDLLRRGQDGRAGLDELAARVRRMRDRARRHGDLAGTLDQVRAALDQALAAERDELAAAPEDDLAARMAELELATIPDDVAGAVRALADYDWRSAEARAAYESIRAMLRQEVLGAQFAGMKRALQGGDAQAMARVRDMLADLNRLLAAHARGEDTTDQFAAFMDAYGDLFPEQPKDVDELIDALARRQAAADRMLASLSPQERAELRQLMGQALADDPGLAAEMAQLSDNLRALRPGMQRGGGPVRMAPGGEPIGYADAVEAVAELADLEALDRQLGQRFPGATLDDVDVDLLERRLGAGAAADLRALRELERELERQGYLSRGDDGLRLTPRAVRRLGETALRRVFAALARGRGDHDDRRSGQADEPTGSSRAWEFGDDLPLDAVRTVANAVARTGARRRPPAPTELSEPHAPMTARGSDKSGGARRPPSELSELHAPMTARGSDKSGGAGRPLSELSESHAPMTAHGSDNSGGGTRTRLAVEDFEVAETERRTTAAVALCVDLSYSMVAEGRWGPMKQTALALTHLVQTRFRQDALQVIGFNITARRLTPLQLAEVEPEWVQGTNLHHALMLAARHLRRHPDAEPVVLVVTDGEPTARVLPSGEPDFHWPPLPATVRATVSQVDELARYGATVNFFLLGEDPGLARLVDAVARRCGGRVVTPSLDRLGEYVVADYLRARRGRRAG